MHELGLEAVATAEKAGMNVTAEVGSLGQYELLDFHSTGNRTCVCETGEQVSEEREEQEGIP